MNGLTPSAVLRGLATGGLVVVWAVLAHYASAGEVPADFSAVLATAPIVAFAVILLWRVGSPLLIALGATVIVALLGLGWPLLRHNVALLYYLQHLGTNLALGALFGRTLYGGREPLVTHFAKLAHDGQISPAKARYTRQVTVAWSLFFATSAGLSTILFWLAPAAAWSIFANLLYTPSLLLMFAIEHLVRLRVLPAADRSGIADTIRGYRASRIRPFQR